MSETILQFGAGRFLRGFADVFVQHANDAGQDVGSVVVVQSMPGGRAELLNRQPRGYHVLVRGLEGGREIERAEPVRSISRALTAATQWDEVERVACSPNLRLIISNTTESGYATDPTDRPDDRPPRSFPAKLTQLLWQRFQKGQPPLTLIPCELIEQNAARLRDLVLSQAGAWSLPAAFLDWAGGQCVWLKNLVDRMVVNPPADHPLAAQDPLLVQVEPYALWAIERPAADSPAWRPPLDHPAVEVVDDLAPYYLRKVRILNGIHSAMVGKFLPQGYVTVQQALKDPVVMDWVLGLLYEEIVPAIAYRVPDLARFARQTLDRLANPCMEHRLADIALNHRDKVQVRLATTAAEYQQLFGQPPRRITEAMQGIPQG